jgi:hypothetical protein
MVSVDGLAEVVEKFKDLYKDTLEELELQTLFEISFFQAIFKNLPNLKLFKYDTEDAPKDLKSYQSLRPNQTLSTAIFCSNSYNGHSVEGLVGNMPNLNTLVLHFLNREASNQLIKFIAVNLNKLKVLEVSRVGDNSFEEVKIPTLQDLHIHATYNMTNDGWTKITESCPNIERLTIGSVSDAFLMSEKELSTIGTNLKKLQHLVIGRGFIGTKKIFHDLMENSQSLKSFTILQSAIVDDKTMIDEFTKNGPKLYIRNAYYYIKRIDFNLWEQEDVEISEHETDNEEGESDFSEDTEIEIDDDDYIDGDPYEWFDNDYMDHEDDDEFRGNFRPG